MANARGSGPVSWGAYLSDYGFYSYARPADPRPVPLLTAATIAYSRRVVADVAQWCNEGAWENVVHDRLCEAGRRLQFAPEARVHHDHRYSVGGFCRDRYEHGWDYARARLTEEPGARRWVLLALTPLLPLVLIRRIGRAAGREDRGAFARALPVTMAFLCSWAAGEAAGYFRGALRAGEEAGRIAAA
jgi:GT2 family glycosyltransferase